MNFTICCRKILLLTGFPLAMLLPGIAQADSEPVRHMVVFKYKDGAPEARIRQITDAFRQLKDSIPGILSFEYGVNNSPENLNRGLTHIYLLTFEDAAARDVYLPHPEHGKFGELVMGSGILDEVFVVDYTPHN